MLPNKNPATRVLILAFTDVASDPRLLRQVSALGENCLITVAGRGVVPNSAVESIDISSCWTRSLLTRIGAGLSLLLRRDAAFFWMSGTSRHRFRRAIAGRSFDAIIANDAECLPAAIDDIAGSPRLVLDVHELKEDEFPERLLWRLLVRPKIRQTILSRVSNVSEITTVCDGIADVLMERYGREARVVMNARSYEALTPREPSPNRVRLVHAGGFQKTRGLRTLVEAVRMLDERFTLDFYLVGGTHLDKFRDECADEPRVRFHPPVPMRDLSGVMNHYDLGVYSLPPTSMNNALSLPNKFFEFIQARVGIGIGPSVEMAKIVQKYNCGVVARDFSAAALVDVLAPLSPEAIFGMKQGAHEAANSLNAEAFAGIIRDTVQSA